MNKEIWKFPLDASGWHDLLMPNGAEILSVDVQNEQPCMWALVDPNTEKSYRRFEIFGTGHPVHCDMGVERKFVGTYLLKEGAFVGHVFERTN